MLYHPRYKTNDDPFGLLVLTLRKKAGLTQVELAKLVGVTEKTVRNWERGTDFPSESNLKKLIETYLCRGVFTPGQEREGAKTLWERACQSASRRKAIFDETWFTVLLAQQHHSTFNATAPAPRADSPEGPPRLRGSGAPALKNSTADWGEASDRAPFSGRGEEASHISPLASSAQLDRLLVTKRTAPSRRVRLVPRAHLTGRLQAEPGRKLTLISAPAGFGKTTLLLDWITSGNQRVAWLSLDEGDNDPVRFWRYVVVALQSALAKTDLETSTLAMLLELGSSQLEMVLADLLNELAAFEQDLALVMDDYQVITTPTIHDSLTFLLERLPAHLQLVIATRVDPPLPLARLRAHDKLVELRADELRFSAEEATHFLRDTMELVLDADQVVQLAERTEGWVAGLQLAALALRGRADVDQFLAHFSGSHRYLMDYLAEDVLRREPEPVQRFLLQTSLLERLCAPLCSALTGSSEAQALLERAERANLFLVPLDDHREWYRYHALFAEFLQERLRLAFPGEGETLHRRAAQWFEEQELIPEAVQHALAGADYERAVRLVTQSARAFLLRGETATLRTWLQALPEDLVRARPRLCMILGNELGAAGEYEAADVWLQAAEVRLRAGESGGADGADAEVADAEVREEGGFQGTLQEVLALRAGNAVMAGDLPLALELVHKVEDHLPSDNPLLRSRVAFDLSGAYYWSGDMVAAGPANREVNIAGAAAGSLYFELLGLVGVGWVHTARGKLRQAAETLRLVLQRIAGQEDQTYWVAGLAPLGLGMVLREWNHLESAEQQLRTGIELTTRWDLIAPLLLGYFQLARVRQARGDAAGALELIAQADKAMRRSGGGLLVGVVAACQAQLWLQQGNLAQAEHWATIVPLDPDQPITLLGELLQLALVRVRIAQGRVVDALEALERLRVAAEVAGRGGSVLEILMLRALAQQRLGNTAQALAQLAEALAQAEPEGYVRLFVDEGPPMQALLEQVLAAQFSHRLAGPQSSTAYLEHLLAAFGGSRAPGTPSGEVAPSAARNQALIEPLKERELAVLRLLATGKSNVEIAHELIVAPSTIKWYLKQLYAKLQVHSRMQALTRARELRLLVWPPDLPVSLPRFPPDIPPFGG
jgi:LuxR family maltose regulon positive regulatory protein